MYPQGEEYKQIFGETVWILCEVQGDTWEESESLLFGLVWVQLVHD